MPEGSSPRVWDCDFAIGSVFTRAGLQSMYSYAGNSITNPPQTATDLSGFGVPWTNPDPDRSVAVWGGLVMEFPEYEYID